MRTWPILLLTSQVLIVACSGGFDDATDQAAEDDPIDDESIENDTLALVPATGPLRFARACQPGTRVTISAVGDVLLHPTLQRQAYSRGWSTLWGRTTKWLDDGQISYANHEGPSAYGMTAGGSLVADPGKVFDNYVYTGFPKFNYHRSLEAALRAASFDVVSTANNHALDRSALGVDRTLDAMDSAGLLHTGTVRRGADGPWSTRVVRNGMDVRFVACTFSTNGISDSSDQVLHCYREKARLLSVVRSLRARSDVDAVIVTPHWGAEYSDTPRQQEIDLAHELLDAGATAIIGAHPHVLQRWEKYRTRDGRETFVIYSLGNFVSRHQYPTLARRSSIVLYLGLTMGSDGKAFVNGVRYMPTYMAYTNSTWQVVAIDEVGGYADSRALSTRMYGPWNLRSPGQSLTTTPECS